MPHARGGTSSTPPGGVTAVQFVSARCLEMRGFRVTIFNKGVSPRAGIAGVSAVVLHRRHASVVGTSV
jgi:hypothetical protein